MSLTLDIQGDIASIHLDDGKANALSFDMLSAINDALDKAEADAKAILFSGRAGRFCAGFDLAVMRNEPDRAADLVNRGGHLMLRLFANPLPTVIACTGHALAAGGLMLLSADTRIGMKGDFKIGLNETAIGMVLPPYGIDLPKARLTQAHFTPAVIQAKAYAPEDAVEAGFLDMAVAGDALLTTAQTIAEQLASLPGSAYYGNKMLIRKAAIDSIRATLVPLG